MLRCGLLGKTLGHSYSPAIHHLLGDYAYGLFEKSEEELPRFLTEGDWDGLNVTIPYKKTVVPYCAALSPAAAALGSVNTLVRRPDGSLCGDNTDLFGFLYLLGRSGLSPAGKKALVLGSGGASVTVAEALRQQGASEVVVISRSGENNYQNLSRHSDAALIVNTTPVGMYPGNGASPLSLTVFPRCEGVLDIVYNPERTALCLEAEKLGIPAFSGLPMLVAQAKKSAELFTGAAIPNDTIESICRTLTAGTRNLILVGMPGCGKTSVGKALSNSLGRPFFDVDQEIVRAAGKTIPEIFAQQGEEAFRDLESSVLSELGKRSGCVLATGGGSVLREKNYDPLHQNGTIFWLRRDLSLLPRTGRPLSQGADLPAMYEARRPRYARFADYAVDNSGAVTDTAEQILSLFFSQDNTADRR